jgi:prephenate dehydratase
LLKPFPTRAEVKRRHEQPFMGQTNRVAAKLNCLIGYKVELSKLNSSRRTVGMWKSLFFSDFQGLWEERETASCFPRFPSDRHFHHFRVRGEFMFFQGPLIV